MNLVDINSQIIYGHILVDIGCAWTNRSHALHTLNQFQQNIPDDFKSVQSPSDNFPLMTER